MRNLHRRILHRTITLTGLVGKPGCACLRIHLPASLSLVVKSGGRAVRPAPAVTHFQSQECQAW